MAVLNVQKSTIAGLTPAYVAANAAGDEFANTGRENVRVRTGGTPVAVTIVARGQCSHGFLHNQTINVPANDEREFGPFRDQERWNDANGHVTLNYDQVVGVTVGVFSE